MQKHVHQTYARLQTNFGALYKIYWIQAKTTDDNVITLMNEIITVTFGSMNFFFSLNTQSVTNAFCGKWSVKLNGEFSYFASPAHCTRNFTPERLDLTIMSSTTLKLKAELNLTQKLSTWRKRKASIFFGGRYKKEMRRKRCEERLLCALQNVQFGGKLWLIGLIDNNESLPPAASVCRRDGRGQGTHKCCHDVGYFPFHANLIWLDRKNVNVVDRSIAFLWKAKWLILQRCLSVEHQLLFYAQLPHYLLEVKRNRCSDCQIECMKMNCTWKIRKQILDVK